MMGSVSLYRDLTWKEDLGIMINSELNFSEHIHVVSKKKQMESWQSSKELLHVLIVFQLAVQIIGQNTP